MLCVITRTPAASPEIQQDAVPGAAIAIESSGDFLGFGPNLHILCSDGCFCGKTIFRGARGEGHKYMKKIDLWKISHYSRGCPLGLGQPELGKGVMRWMKQRRRHSDS